MASAQTTKYATSPVGFLSIEGGTYASNNPVNPNQSGWEFGAYPEYRSQIMDSSHAGTGSVRILTAVDMRIDNARSFSPADARTWTNVQLLMGTGDYTQSTTNFSTNFSSTPTSVFSSSVTWPGFTSQPYASWPAPWGKEVSFPFKGIWLQANVTGTILDFHFTGGKLIGSTNPWDQSNPQNYPLDAHWTGSAQSGYQNPVTAGIGCRDSNRTADSNGYMYTRTFAKDSFQNPDQFYLDRGMFEGGSNTTHFAAHSIGEYVPRVPFPGVTCNEIVTDLGPSKLIWIEPVMTNATGYWRQIQTLPYVAIPAGIRVYIQFAWEDSVTKQIMLSRANSSELAVQPVGKMASLVQIGTNNPIRSQQITRMPLLRYSY